MPVSLSGVRLVEYNVPIMGSLKGQAPGKGLAARHRVAGGTVGRAREIFAACHGISLCEACGNAGRVRCLKIGEVHALAARESRGISAA